LAFEQQKNGDVALAALDKMPETTEEIRICCADLKVLGRKEFKLLLRWRLKVREIFGFPTKKSTAAAAAAESEEVAEVEPMDEELKIQEELQAMKDRESSKKKREKRKENEQKQKDIIRMQMNMTAPMDIGMEQAGPMGEGAMFALKSVDETDALRRLARGKMTVISEAEAKKDRDSGIGSSPSDDESDEAEDRLEEELDNMYNEFRERKAATDAKYRAKRARQEHEDGEWEGLSVSEHDSDDEGFEEDSSDEDDEDDEDEVQTAKKPLLKDLDNEPSESGGLSKRARRFFNQDIFKDITGDLEEEDGEDEVAEEIPEDEDIAMNLNGVEEEEEDASDEADMVPKPVSKKKKNKQAAAAFSDSEESDEGGFEVVKRDEEDEDWEEADKLRQDGRPGELHPMGEFEKIVAFS
jgi:AdoMet-dependent rRNA methyltransferase SPB1